MESKRIDLAKRKDRQNLGEEHTRRAYCSGNGCIARIAAVADQAPNVGSTGWPWRRGTDCSGGWERILIEPEQGQERVVGLELSEQPQQVWVLVLSTRSQSPLRRC